MAEWWKCWHGAPMDPKWLVVARQAHTTPSLVVAVWWALLDHASQAVPRGTVGRFDADVAAAFLGHEPEEIRAVLDVLTARGLIAATPDGGLVVAKWAERQRDTSTERVRAWRERQGGHETGQPDETRGNAAKRSATAPKRQEKKREEKKTPPELSRAPGLCDAESEALDAGLWPWPGPGPGQPGCPAPQAWQDRCLAARDVPPGASWAFHDHRTLAQVFEEERQAERMASSVQGGKSQPRLAR